MSVRYLVPVILHFLYKPG